MPILTNMPLILSRVCSGWLGEGLHTALRKVTPHTPVQEEPFLPSSLERRHRNYRVCGHFSTKFHFPGLGNVGGGRTLLPCSHQRLWCSSTSRSSELYYVVLSGRTWALSESKGMLGTTPSKPTKGGSVAMATRTATEGGQLTLSEVVEM